MTDREAMSLALDALEDSMYPQKRQFDAIVALKQALAQPEQEPVAYMGSAGLGYDKNKYLSIPLYTAPPIREWVGLTDEDTANICMQGDLNDWHDEQVIDAVESRLKEKNGG